MVLASLVSPILTTYGLPSDESKAEHFLEIAQTAKRKVDELIDIAESLNLTLPPPLVSDYATADALLGSANQTFYDEGDFEAAVEQAKEAMKAFRRLYGETYAFLEEEGIDLEIDNGTGLRVAIDRARTRLDRVEGILNRSEAAGMNVTEARTLLEEARTLLEQALALQEALVDPYEGVEEAAHKLGEANSMIAHSLASTKGAAGRFNVHRIRADSGLIKSLKNQVRRLEKQLDLAERKGLEVENMRILLSDAESLIAEAGELAEVDTEEAIMKLVQAREIIDAVDEELRTDRRGGPT